MTTHATHRPTMRLRARPLASGLLLVAVVAIGVAEPLRAQESGSEPGSDQASATSRSGNVWAGVEELIVTGSTATDLLSDVANANSVTAFDAAELEAIGASDISDIAAFTPNLEIVTAGQTSPTLFIRGIGLNDFNANAAGAVAVFQDGVAINSPALQLGTLFDTETTNVLRGPQGTGANRNASAGAIKVYSRKPTGDFSAYSTFSYGRFDLVDLEGGVEFPIVQDRLSGRFAFRMIQRDGIMRNRCGGAPPLVDREEAPGRAQAPATAPPHSICGEVVNTGSISNVDVGAPDWLNDRDNWAARGLLRFQPDVAWADMDWLLILRGSRRDEYSTVGQSIGTSGTQRFPDTGAPNINGLLGRLDQGDYISEDVRAEVDAVVRRKRSALGCFDSCTPAQNQLTLFTAQREVAENLARRLDIKPFEGNFSHAGKTTNDTFGVALNGDVAIGSVVLDWVTGYDQWKRLIDVDLDFSPNTLFETASEDEGFQIYQELSARGQAFDRIGDLLGGPIDWEVGGYFLYEYLDVSTDINADNSVAQVTGRDYSQKIWSLAGYANLSWDIWDDFTLDGGVRFNWERRSIDYLLFRSNIQIPNVQNEDIVLREPSGTIRLTYRASPDLRFYAKYTHGWKSGTYNATGSNRFGVTFAEPEINDAFEVGLQGGFFDNRVDFLATFFHYAYQDYQLFTSQNAAQAPPEFVILNAEDVELYGSEVEVTARPWTGTTAMVRFAWLEGEFIKFIQTQLAEVPRGATSITIDQSLNNSGNRLLNAPQFSVNLMLQHTVRLGRMGSLTPRWDSIWKDDTFFDATEGRGIPNDQQIQFLPRNTIGQEAFWLHNFRLTYRSPGDRVSVSGWIRNITDKVYKVFSADLTTFQKTTLHFLGEPRTYGLTVSVRY